MGFGQDRGRAAEAMAASYLELMGCRVVARNARLGGVEVDLVVEDCGDTVIAEVRMRARGDYGGAALTVDHRKQQRLVRAAHALEQQGARRVRVDVVAVDITPDGATLTHYRNAVME